MGSRSFKVAFTVGLIASAAFSMSACSDDEEKPSTPGTGGTAGAGGSGGTASPGGTAGVGGASGTGGFAGNPSVTCGDKTCPPAGLGFIPACCIENSRCGIDPPGFGGTDIPCTEVDQPGNPDPSCFADAGPGTGGAGGAGGTGGTGGGSGGDASSDDASSDDASSGDASSDDASGGRGGGGQIDASLPISGCCRPNGVCGILVNLPQAGLNLGCVDPASYGALFDAGPPQSCTPRP